MSNKKSYVTKGTDHVVDLIQVATGLNVEALQSHWFLTYNTYKRYKGKQYAVEYMKSLYGIAVQYSLHQKVKPLSFHKCDKDGIPKDLKPFKRLLRSSVYANRAVLTILRQFEKFKCKPDTNIKSVTEPADRLSKFHLNKFQQFVETKFRRNMPLIVQGAPEDHFSSKRGPAGKPAVLEWAEDISNLDQETFEAIKELGVILKDASSPERLDWLKERAKDYSSDAPTTRIQVFAAPGGKTRVIAVYDYWSQRVLKPLHKAIFSNLSKVESDCTFGHKSASEWIKTQDPSVPLYSYDLTAATDRIPMQLHRIILQSMLVKRQAMCVPLIEKILLRNFQLSWDTTKQVTYGCGQPMGAYGSWALLAYTHHAIAQYCGARKSDYRIIGDDIVIRGNYSGKKYLNFMNSFGIKISKSKSIISGGNLPFIVGEVAKRLILGDKEITPPTTNLISKAYRDWHMFPILLEDMCSRGYLRKDEFPVELLDKWYSAKWSNNVLTVLSFPYYSHTSASTAMLERVVSVNRDIWFNLDTQALQISLLRVRAAKLNRTALKIAKSKDLQQFISGGVPLDFKDKRIYMESPVGKQIMVVTSKMLQTSMKLINLIKSIEAAGIEEHHNLSEILRVSEEELYVPSVIFHENFQERKFERTKFISSTILETHKHIRNGTLDEFCKKHSTSALMFLT